jgi:phosphoserine phosphatase
VREQWPASPRTPVPGHSLSVNVLTGDRCGDRRPGPHRGSRLVPVLLRGVPCAPTSSQPVPVLPFLWDEFRDVRDRDEQPGMPQRATHAALEATRGCEQAEPVEWCRQCVEESMDRFLVPELLESATDLKALGIPVFAATASPQELAVLAADRPGRARGLGTIAEAVDGRYTGWLATPILHWPEKIARVRRLFADLGANPSTSRAIRASINDPLLLSAVGWPVAVNADANLSKAAASREGLTIHGGLGRERVSSARANQIRTMPARHHEADGQHDPRHKAGPSSRSKSRCHWPAWRALSARHREWRALYYSDL